MAYSYTYLGLVNRVLEDFNEVPLTSMNFASAAGFQAYVKDYVNDALLDIGICYDHGAYVNIPYESTIKKLESQGVSKKNNMFQKVSNISCSTYR